MLILFAIGISCAQDSIKITSFGKGAVMLVKDSKALNAFDMDHMNKQNVIQKQSLSYDSIIATKISTISDNIELLTNSPPKPLIQIAMDIGWPVDRIEKAITRHVNGYKMFNTTGILMIIVVVIFAAFFNRNDIRQYFLFYSFAIAVLLLWYFAIPVAIDRIFNSDYYYIKTLLELSG